MLTASVVYIVAVWAMDQAHLSGGCIASGFLGLPSRTQRVITEVTVADVSHGLQSLSQI